MTALTLIINNAPAKASYCLVCEPISSCWHDKEVINIKRYNIFEVSPLFQIVSNVSNKPINQPKYILARVASNTLKKSFKSCYKRFKRGALLIIVLLLHIKRIEPLGKVVLLLLAVHDMNSISRCKR